MILMTRPDGGQTWVHESRLEEYRRRGYNIPASPKAVQKTDTPSAKKTTRKK